MGNRELMMSKPKLIVFDLGKFPQVIFSVLLQNNCGLYCTSVIEMINTLPYVIFHFVINV